MHVRPSLVIFGGLPGTGKTTVACQLAGAVGAAYVRIDALEAAMRNAGIERAQPTGIAAYETAVAVANGCLRVGTSVIIDAVNPVEAARAPWRKLAADTGARLHVIEVRCVAVAEHQRRVAARSADLAGQTVPTWQQVLDREYEPWTEERLLLDSTDPRTDHVGAALRYMARPV